MSTALLLIAILSFAAIAWRDLKLAIFIILAALPSYLIRFSIGPVPTTLLEILILLVFARSIATKQSRERLLRFARRDIFTIPILLLLLASTISIFIAPDRLAALGIWRAYFVEPILFFYIVRLTLSEPEDRNHALQALGIGAIAVSLFAIIQYVSGFGIPVPWDFERRVTSFFEYPNAVGLYLAPIVSVAVVLLFSKTKNLKSKNETKTKYEILKPKLFWISITVLGTTAIIFAKTEAALVAIPAALLIVAFLKTENKKVKGGLVLGTLLLFSIAFQIPGVKEKLLLSDYSGMVRRSQWRETSEMLQDHWLLGAGLSGYPAALEPYHIDTQYEIFQYPHNIFLNIWSELGLLGLIAFILLAIRVLRLSTTQPLSDSSTSFLIFAALLTMTIHGLVDVPYFKNDLAVMTWSLLALISSYSASAS